MTTAASKHPYELYAELLDYPQPDLAAAAERAGVPELAAWAAGVSYREVEELYTRTFDLQPPCCLEVGWHLFGESYKRGSFLVKMTVAAREHGVEPGVEMPDHLSVVLRLLPRLGPDEDARGLVEEAVLPAMEKMLEGFGDRQGNPYRALLVAVAERLRRDYDVRPAVTPPPQVHLPVYSYPEVER